MPPITTSFQLHNTWAPRGICERVLEGSLGLTFSVDRRPLPGPGGAGEFAYGDVHEPEHWPYSWEFLSLCVSFALLSFVLRASSSGFLVLPQIHGAGPTGPIDCYFLGFLHPHITLTRLAGDRVCLETVKALT